MKGRERRPPSRSVVLAQRVAVGRALGLAERVLGGPLTIGMEGCKYRTSS